MEEQLLLSLNANKRLHAEYEVLKEKSKQIEVKLASYDTRIDKENATLSKLEKVIKSQFNIYKDTETGLKASIVKLQKLIGLTDEKTIADGFSMTKEPMLLMPIDIVYTWVNGSDPRLISNLNRVKRYVKTSRGPDNSDVTANRFEDHGALKYSLRSLEQYAPWFRHVYIVTNGQVPTWLNLQNKRISIITHQVIFLNQSHLPTFNSKAIESNIHRIPGLSDKFIYLNDDFFFGSTVSVNDFFTEREGQEVYLSWTVPICNVGCIASMLKNGKCDKPCNTMNCGWDGGECIGVPLPVENISTLTNAPKANAAVQPAHTYDNKYNNTNTKSSRKESIVYVPSEKLSHKTEDSSIVNDSYMATHYQTRKLLDIFTDTVLHVDSLYNLEFGHAQRRVISHVPFMVDKHVMKELQERFPKQWESTSSHQFRRSDDMQYAFAYIYYLMNAKTIVTLADLFAKVDADNSQMLSLAEVRTFADSLTDVPDAFNKLAGTLHRCAVASANVSSRQSLTQLSQIKKHTFLNCSDITKILNRNLGSQNKYRYSIAKQTCKGFVKLTNDVKIVQRDLTRLKRFYNCKFKCVNDDIDYTKANYAEVVALVRDFYNSLFPHRSQFELPDGQINGFTHIDELVSAPLQTSPKVWMDIDQMGGSTVGAMANAVENAGIILTCISQKYKNSQNCRAEAEYAFQLKKTIIPLKIEPNYKADGWLGLICGTKLYIEFSGKYPFDRKLQELLKTLEKTT